MIPLDIQTDINAQAKIDSFPLKGKSTMLLLRGLIFELAKKSTYIDTIKETLKWNELSYVTKVGSTIRIDYKVKNPDKFGIYFNCNTSLVETFKHVYGDIFQYEKNRAIHIDLNSKKLTKELSDCINMALHYHLLKDKPFLGK